MGGSKIWQGRTNRQNTRSISCFYAAVYESCWAPKFEFDEWQIAPDLASCPWLCALDQFTSVHSQHSYHSLALSLSLSLSTSLDLYANVMHCQSLPGVQTRHRNIDIIIIRENTEGEYSNLEHEVSIFMHPLNRFSHSFACFSHIFPNLQCVDVCVNSSMKTIQFIILLGIQRMRYRSKVLGQVLLMTKLNFQQPLLQF